MQAVDPEGTSITYAIAYANSTNARPNQLAADTAINQSTGVFTFDPSTNSAHAGTFKARLSASDGIAHATRFVNFTLAFNVSAEILLVGGGGGGNNDSGGAGGGGAGASGGASAGGNGSASSSSSSSSGGDSGSADSGSTDSGDSSPDTSSDSGKSTQSYFVPWGWAPAKLKKKKKKKKKKSNTGAPKAPKGDPYKDHR